MITSIFGDSVAVIRMVPALLSSVVVFISCKTAEKLGGGSFAVFFTALSITFMPIFMGMNSIYSMNFIEYLFWAILIYLTIDLIEEPVGRKFIIIGVMAVWDAQQNKCQLAHCGFFVTLLISDKRDLLKPRSHGFTGIIAPLFFSPYIVWNILNDFAHLEFMRNAVEGNTPGITRVQFLAGQLMLVSPFNSGGCTFRAILPFI
ncbi:MAG: glycosyltransferase family 39 protein [Ignavibacteriales bacterium]|nr:glycosyltransferase family 39 protein [Ignavibacteriales bacterium]